MKVLRYSALNPVTLSKYTTECLISTRDWHNRGFQLYISKIGGHIWFSKLIWCTVDVYDIETDCLNNS